MTEAKSGLPVPVGPASIAPTLALAQPRVWTLARGAVLAAAGAWFLWVLDEGSAPISDMFAYLLVAATGAVLVLAWAVITVFCPGAFLGWWRAATWASVPFVGVAAGWVLTSDRPVAARVWLSETSLQAYAERVGHQPPRGKEWIGLFDAEHEDRLGTPKDCVLVRTGSNFTGIGGVAYAPAGPPAEQQHLYFSHLYGPWYRWRYSD